MEAASVEGVQNVSSDNLSETVSVTSSSDVSIPPRPADLAAKDLRHLALSSQGDINSAIALRAQYAIQIPKTPRRRRKKMNPQLVVKDDPVHHPEDEPVVDHTATLPLHSKKTERLQRKQVKKSLKAADQQSRTTSLLSLPSELLTEIFSHLLPTDIPRLLLTNQALHELISHHEAAIARSIIRRRYWTLHRCFPAPVAFEQVPADAHAALLSPKRQEMLNIHRKSYHQHVQMVDPADICTCMTCVFAWNNLCLVVDLHHWQPHLESRTPLPVVARGADPPWNRDLLRRHAALVRRAVDRPLVYARLLMIHLDTVTATILRNARWRRSASSSSSSKNPPVGPTTSTPAAGTSSSSSSSSSSSFANAKPLLYHLKDADVAAGTDEFLDRSGPPSYDFPFMRDNYYSLEAYLPNRKWSAETASWHYYGLPPLQHERDLEWVRSSAMGAGWKG